MSFNDRDYTQDAIIKQASLIELHSKDGSAFDAGCECIEGKHLHIIEGLAEEGVGFALTEKEKKFYEQLGNFARNLRKTMEDQAFEFPHSNNPHNPNLSCQRKIERCVLKLKADPNIENPHAVCRAKIKCP